MEAAHLSSQMMLEAPTVRQDSCILFLESSAESALGSPADRNKKTFAGASISQALITSCQYGI